jgi:drug/metabolite transporter (DMT)-like permease
MTEPISPPANENTSAKATFPNASEHPFRSVAALMVGAIAIGFAPIFVRLSEVGPSATAFWRITLALPPMLMWAAKSRSNSRDGKGNWLILGVTGAFFAADLAVWHWALQFTSVANATLEANLASIFVTLLAWLFFKQRVSTRFLVALAVAVLGTILLVGKNAHISSQTLQGDALGVATALFYSGYILSVKMARDRGLGTASIMAISGLITAAVLYPIALLSSETIWPSSLHGWTVLLGLALISHLGGQSLIAYALAELPASVASVGLLVQPATAAVAAWALLGESLAPAQLAGGVILIAGLYLARRDAC